MTDAPNNPVDQPQRPSEQEAEALAPQAETSLDAAVAPEDSAGPVAEGTPVSESLPEESTPEESMTEESTVEESGSADVAEESPAAEPVATEVAEGDAAAEAEASEEEAPAVNMDWYILKVQSNREDSIREGLLRRVKIAGLEHFFGDVIVPIEKVTEFKGGKKRVMKRKLYPGYIVVNMEINDDTWFLVRETPGIGDFTGAAGTPTPMLPHEVARIKTTQEEKTEEQPKLKIGFQPGDQVKINEGTFENFEGEVESIDETNGQVTVMINIFGRSTPVTLEYWQVETV